MGDGTNISISKKRYFKLRGSTTIQIGKTQNGSDAEQAHDQKYLETVGDKIKYLKNSIRSRETRYRYKQLFELFHAKN